MISLKHRNEVVLGHFLRQGDILTANEFGWFARPLHGQVDLMERALSALAACAATIFRPPGGILTILQKISLNDKD